MMEARAQPLDTVDLLLAWYPETLPDSEYCRGAASLTQVAHTTQMPLAMLLGKLPSGCLAYVHNFN